jgi:NADH dehydrogenase
VVLVEAAPTVPGPFDPKLQRYTQRRLAKMSDRAGRVTVQPDCTVPGHPEVFAIGDMVSLNGLPGVAQPAMHEGEYVGKVSRARLKGNGTVAPFKYFDKGSVATIGRNAARRTHPPLSKRA